MDQAEVGSHVVYTRKEAGIMAAHDAVVIGYEHLAEGEVLPAAHLAFLNAQQLAVLNGVDWHRAMEEVFSVPFGEAEGHHYYELDPALKLADALAMAQEKLLALDSVMASAEAESMKLITALQGKVESLDSDLAIATKQNDSLSVELQAALSAGKTAKK